MLDLFTLHADLMNGNVFLLRSLRLGFLLFVFLHPLFFLLFYFVFCCRLVDSLVQNPLLMSDLFGLRADLMKGDIFWVLPLPPSFCFFLYSFLLQVPLLPPCYGSYSWSFSFFLILLFYFIFCYRLIDSLLRNPLLMPDLFGLLTDLIKGDLFFFVLPLLPSFILVFFLYFFLLQVLLLSLVPCAAFLSFASRLFFALCRPRSLLIR
jgi:hypothetical protein